MDKKDVDRLAMLLAMQQREQQNGNGESWGTFLSKLAGEMVFLFWGIMFILFLLTDVFKVGQ